MPAKNGVFRAYDIRGVVEKDFTTAWVERLGRACGSYFLGCGHAAAVVGHDCRLSSPVFHEALTRGLAETGVDVISVGMVPTPALYFAVRHLRRQAGIMITASHNPPEYNGFKIWSGATTIHGAEIRRIGEIFESGHFSAGRGLTSSHDILPSYTEGIVARTRLARPVKVVVDGGNGVGGGVLVDVLRRLGAEVVPLYCEPDGTFPHHHPDPVVEANMRDLTERVRQEGAELGIGLDGDADRLGVVDGAGRLLHGDELLAVFAHDVLERCPGALIMGDVKCSDRLFEDIRQRGGRPLMCATGHSVAKAKMAENGALLAGELSGHIFFNEGWYGFDDAVYGAARLLDILTCGRMPLTSLPGWPPTFSTREVQLPCADEHKFAVVRAARDWYRQGYPVEDMDGARVRFPHGWGLVRASNTQPAVVLRFEADSREHLAALREEMETRVRGWAHEMNHPPVL